MMDALRIKSARDAFELVLGPVRGKAGQGSFAARLLGGPAGAEVDAYDLRYDSLAAFFDGMAAESSGWEGEKAWESLEEHVSLKATMDRLGHIFLASPSEIRWTRHGGGLRRSCCLRRDNWNRLRKGRVVSSMQAPPYNYSLQRAALRAAAEAGR